MAQALTTHIPVRLTCSSTAGQVTVLTAAQDATWLRIRPITSDGFLTQNVADGVDKGSAYETYDADTCFWVYCGSRLASGVVAVAHTDNSGVIEVTALPDSR